MRSPGVIYRRYRQLRKKLLFDKVVEASKQKHTNCHYGKLLQYYEEKSTDLVNRRVCLCLYPCQRGDDPEICDCPQECNAYVNKWTRELIEKKFNEEISDPNVKAMLYPELCVMEWVLDKSLNEAKKEPSFIGKLIIFCIRSLENLLKRVSGPEMSLME